MIKWPITYTNFDDVEVTQDFYFHLSKKKLIEMVLESGGDFDTGGGASGLGDHLSNVVKSGDNVKIMSAFTDIVAESYGLREPGDANSFVQNDGLKAGFMNSPAFDALLTQLLESEEDVTKFIRGIVPSDMKGFVEANVTQQPGTPAVVKTGSGMPSKEEMDKLTGLKDPRDRTGELVPWAFRAPTDQELTAMTKAQMLDAMRRSQSDWAPKPL